MTQNATSTNSELVLLIESEKVSSIIISNGANLMNENGVEILFSFALILYESISTHQRSNTHARPVLREGSLPDPLNSFGEAAELFYMLVVSSWCITV